MSTAKPSLILPVENIVREMDAKLLLACVAAERGYTCLIGSRPRVDRRVGHFSPSIYFSKSMTKKSGLMFRILTDLGNEIVVQDEECLAYYSAEHYQAARLSPKTIHQPSTFFTWGPDSESLIRKYSHFPGTPIHTVGSPRIDLLRPELREFFAADVAQLHERFGNFVLINANFAMVNGFFDSFNVVMKPSEPGKEPELGAAGIGVTREFALGYSEHKTALFEAFKAFLPVLSRAFPERTFILRPHPSEKQDPWDEIASPLSNVKVLHEGNIVPWLLATDALIHNGCTTSAEAAVAGTPSISFQPVKNELYDADFCNGLSWEATSQDALCDTLARVLDGDLQGKQVPGADLLLDQHLSSLTGPLASDRMIDVLDQSSAVRDGFTPPSLEGYVKGHGLTFFRNFKKRFIKERSEGNTNNPEYQQHRFPGVSLEDLQSRIARFSQILQRFEGVKVEPVAEHVYRVRV